MNTSPNNSLLCPGCRKLISRDEPTCPYCGMTRPGSKLKANWWTQGLQSPESLIKAIVYANVGFYILSLLLDPRGFRLSMNPMAFLSPSSESLLLLGATGDIPISGHRSARLIAELKLLDLSNSSYIIFLMRWCTLISANYLHGSLLHIVFNMLVLRQIGLLAIREFGTHRMLIIYTLSGAGGFWVSYVAGVPFTIGASAAVCGLIGAVLYFGKSRGGVYGNLVYRQIGGWAVGLLIIGFLPGINNWGHGGGFLFGLLLAYLLGYQEKRPERFGHKAVAGICALATLIVLSGSALFGAYYTYLG